MEENIRYITNDDIPNIVEPCYITSSGELWQWSLRQNKMKQKSVCYDRCNDKAKVNIMLYDKDSKVRNTKPMSVSVASLVYRYFNEIDMDMSKRLDIGHFDHDVMNCRLDNLYLLDVNNVSRPKKEERIPHSDKYGLQIIGLPLVLSDFDSVMTFLEMKSAYPQAAETKLTIDTTDWTAEQLRKLLKIRARLGDTIIK